KVKAIEEDLRPNVVAILDQALYIRRPDTTEFDRIQDDVLYQFLSVLRLQVERFPRGGTDLGAYLPATAQLCWMEGESMSSMSATDEELEEDSGGTGPL